MTGNTNFLRHIESVKHDPADPVEELLIREYGAVFTAQGVLRPDRAIFRNEAEVQAFQERIDSRSAQIGGVEIELQRAALEALLNSREAARSKGLDITPRGADSAKRSYDETVKLWKSRVEPALLHWVAHHRLSQTDAERIRGMATYEQVREVLRLEKEEIYFAKDLSKSIIYSVAPPGTSQHLSLLAFDAAQHDDAEVRAILSAHGWIQTVTSDLPHFTFLGAEETELPSLGLKRLEHGGRTFWVPDI